MAVVSSRAPRLVNKVIVEPAFTISESEGIGVNQLRRCSTCKDNPSC